MALKALSLDGRRALVTGGGSGLGRQVALGLAEAGAEIVVCGRRAGHLDETVRLIREMDGRGTAIGCDVTNEQDVDSLQREAALVDILVNNAAVSPKGSWDTLPLTEWRSIFAVNLDAAFRLCQVFAPPMRERHWGRIINVSSIYGSLGGDPSRYPGMDWDVPAYFSSKHGLHGLTRYLATRLAPDGICVNSLSPGMFPYTAEEVNPQFLAPDLVARLIDGTPMKRLGTNEDLKAAAVFLASPGAAFVTGQDLIVDGGWSVW